MSINLGACDDRFKTSEEELFDVQVTLIRMRILFLVMYGFLKQFA